MMNVLDYKGYTGSVNYSCEDKCFFGSILGIRDLVSYEGNSKEELESSFHKMTDHYIQETICT